MRGVTLGLAAAALITAATLPTTGAARASTPTARPSPAAAVGDPVTWPGGGRFLTDPDVLGSDLIGKGALELINGAITGNIGNDDAAPPELALRTFAFVQDPAGGYSAVFRFAVPIVQLHSWRGIPIRHTIAVLLTAPDGTEHTVELQPDGTTAVGTGSGGAFAATGPSTSAIAGTVAVLSVPASVGVGADWTVQGLVRVDSDARLHPDNSLVLATGYEVGTSVVPVGTLSGESASSAADDVLDAKTELLGSFAVPPTPVPVPDAVRAVSLRFEGTGPDLVAVVTTAAPLASLPPYDHGPNVDLQLAQGGLDPLRLAVDVTVHFNGGAMEPNADVETDGLRAGTVPVTVAGSELRLALGQFSAATLVVDPDPTKAVMDRFDGQIVVPLSRDEAVSSADGLSNFTVAPTEAQIPNFPPPAKAADSATIALDSGAMTITRASTGGTATGFVDQYGDFVASNATDHYIGQIDHYGNTVIYDSTATAAAGSGATTGATPIPVTSDYDVASIAAAAASGGPILTGLTFYKGPLDQQFFAVDTTPPVSPADWIKQIVPASGSAPAPTAGAADWPLTAVSATATPPAGLVGPSGPFIVRMSALVLADDGSESTPTGPWIQSELIPALPTPVVVATTVPSTTVTPAAAAAASTVATTAVATSTATAAATSTAVPSTSSDGSGSALPWVVVVIVVIGAATAGVVIRRRRRGVAPPAPPPATVRAVHGTAHVTVSPSDAGHEISVRGMHGTSVITAHEPVADPATVPEPGGTR
ncbi:MAG: hypothetical protein JWM34_707 [Ilumatobacteraceae bacterium]|nr:hypothetical protein [Ilumatobacteraceae bacterium]